MELATYRAHIEHLNAYFGGKGMLSTKEVCDYVGHTRYWCRKHLGIGEGGITVVGLAHKLAVLDK